MASHFFRIPQGRKTHQLLVIYLTGWHPNMRGTDTYNIYLIKWKYLIHLNSNQMFRVLHHELKCMMF